MARIPVVNMASVDIQRSRLTSAEKKPSTMRDQEMLVRYDVLIDTVNTCFLLVLFALKVRHVTSDTGESVSTPLNDRCSSCSLKTTGTISFALLVYPGCGLQL